MYNTMLTGTKALANIIFTVSEVVHPNSSALFLTRSIDIAYNTIVKIIAKPSILPSVPAITIENKPMLFNVIGTGSNAPR